MTISFSTMPFDSTARKISRLIVTAIEGGDKKTTTPSRGDIAQFGRPVKANNMTLREMAFAAFVGTGILWAASAVILGVSSLNAVIAQHEGHEAPIKAPPAATADLGDDQTLRQRNSAQVPDGD